MPSSISSVPEKNAVINPSPPSESPPTPNTDFEAAISGGAQQEPFFPPSFSAQSQLYGPTRIYDEAFDYEEDLNTPHVSEIYLTPKMSRPLAKFGVTATGSPVTHDHGLMRMHQQANGPYRGQPNNIRLPTNQDLRGLNTAIHRAGLKPICRPVRTGDLSQPFPAVFEDSTHTTPRQSHPGSVVNAISYPTPQSYGRLPGTKVDGVGDNGWPSIYDSKQEPATPPFFSSLLNLPRPPAPTQPSKFRPMAALGDSRRAPVPANNLGVVPVDIATFSDNYRGEHTMRNASVADLAEDKNCALWLTNLPPDVTHHELLARIRNIGRIWCTVINAPDYTRHITAAAKVVFFTPQPAQNLLTYSVSRGLTVRDHQVKVTRNRVKYREEPLVGNESRVLIITGKSSFVNEQTLTKFFQERFIFEIDEVRGLIVNAAGRSVIEYKFGSYRCQAQMGKMALEKDKPEGFEKVEFGDDPCEVGDTLSSYEVAGRRIVGRLD